MLGTENVISIYQGQSTAPVAKVYAGTAGGDTDDHDGPAIILEAGRKPIILYSQHGAQNYLNWRVGVDTIDADPLMAAGFGDEQTLDTSGGVTYPHAYVDSSGTIHALFRDTNDYWTYTKSTDWGATFADPVRVLHHSAQSDLSAVQPAADPDSLRVATGLHPGNDDESIWYCEIDLSTGEITKSDGTSLGNLDGTNLPLTVASSLEVAAAAAGGVTAPYKWEFDVGDGPNPEIVWVSFANGTGDTSLASTSEYQYTARSGTTWTTTSIIAAGGRFSDTSQPYIGGGQFPRQTRGGVVYVARESSGTWSLDRMTTTDGGTTWATETIAQSAAASYVRAWPIEPRSGQPPFILAANVIDEFTSFNSQRSAITLVGPNPHF
jgi:hypothetical protein